MGSRPLIGIAPRYQLHPSVPGAPEGEFSPEEVIATVYSRAILAAGGLPVVLPLCADPEVVEQCVAMCDGFAIPGGQDVDPALWGEPGYDPTLLCPERDAFEMALIPRVLAADKPLFTTCRGAQILNVALGGTLCMDVPSLGAPAGMMQWRHTLVLTTPAHPVVVEEGSMLSRILGYASSIQVNSAHHCCVDKLGEGVRLVASATDGVPEAIEVPGKRFVLGVQWHPEYTWESLETDFALWRAFVAACR